MTIIYEVGTAPDPKRRYRVQVLNRDGEWREVEDVEILDIAKTWADFRAREYNTKARVVDTALIP